MVILYYSTLFLFHVLIDIAVELSGLGVFGLLDQILGLKINSALCCEACLRAICSLLCVPSVTGPKALIVLKRFALLGSGIVYRILKAAQMHIAEDPPVVLQWALRILYFLSIEPSGRLRTAYTQ